jgi:Lipase (class 3)
VASVAPTLECRLINASIAAYYIQDGRIDPNAPGYDKIGIAPGTVPTVFIGGSDQIDAGYVAETVDDWVFLVFRGTIPPFTGDFWRWIDDWLHDLLVEPTTWMVDGKPFGQVEDGFASAVLDLWPTIVGALNAIDLGSKKGIIVTGHSKGAAASFLAASLLKGQDFKSLLVEVCCFAAPLVADSTFAASYDALRLTPFSVRYQNEYDAVPFLPYWPFLDLLAAGERLDRGANLTVTEAPRTTAVENDYVPIGTLRFITTQCGLEYGQKAASDAWADFKDALFSWRFQEIVDAHSAQGRYLTCVCS